MATVSDKRQPDVAPVGFEFDGEHFYIGGLQQTKTNKYKNVAAGNTTGARVVRIGTSSVTFQLQTWEEGSRRVVIDAKLIQVIVDHKILRPRPVPSFFIEAVERLQGTPVPRGSVAEIQHDEGGNA